MTSKQLYASIRNVPHLKLAMITCLVIGIFFRSYNLSWGQPYFFHPDERNIANSISQLEFPKNFNPHFFAYGSLPIYSIYIVGITVNLIEKIISHQDANIFLVSFERSIIIGRLLSLFFSLLLLRLIYRLTASFFEKRVAYLSVSLTALSVGLIQYSHFATFEMWLTTLTFALCYCLLCFVRSQRFVLFLLISLIMGCLMSVKISSLFLLPIPLFFIIFSSLKTTFFKKNIKIIKTSLLQTSLRVVLFLGIIVIVLQITSPFFWLDNKSFISSIRYETDVATGALNVFYTQTFSNSTPIIFHLFKVFPFILNPVIFLAAMVLIPFAMIKAFRTKNRIIAILFVFMFVLFLSQAFLYVKWIRYFIPLLPFIYIIFSYSCYEIYKIKKIKASLLVAFFIFLISSCIFAFSYFKTVLVDPDTRVSASQWASRHVPGTSRVASEVYDLGIVPFNSHLPNIELFNFYELENDRGIADSLASAIDQAEYVILPSARILESRLSNPSSFPIGNMFYQNLIHGTLGFKKVYETKCDVFCKMLYITSPYSFFEQTSNVFDRPTVLIYKKVGP